MKQVTELEVQREATDDYIQGSPTSIALTRHTEQPDGAGGFTELEAILPAQDFHLVGEGDSPESVSDAGDLANYEVQLIGYHDADIQDGDTFTLGGGRFRVTFVYPERNYRTLAHAVYRGVA